MCFCYPAINTSWNPSTIHKCVDGDTRPIHNSFLPSREASLLCKELEGNHSELMGSAGNNGVQIRPAHDPHQGKRPTVLHHCQTDHMHALITEEVQELLAKQAIGKHKSSPTVSYPDSSLWKKGGKQRPVIYLKALNSFMCSEHFKMEVLHILPDLIQSGDYMIKLDLKDAYLQIPISIRITNTYSNFRVRKRHTSSCHVPPLQTDISSKGFYQSAQPPLRILRQIGIQLSTWTRSFYPPSKQGGVRVFSSSDLQPV